MRRANDEYRLTTESQLTAFVVAVLARVGVSDVDARTVAEVLAASDLRGIESHGVARLDSYYVARIRAELLDPTPRVAVVRETPTTIVFDGGNGLGHPVATRAMDAVIAKARACGVAFGAVRNSNHYGIAGYYAMRALPYDLVGIASTNTVRYGAPTFGKDVLLGTSPWAYAVPTHDEPPFVLDFATTTVPRGKLEVYGRKGRALEPGWAIDADGAETLDARAALTGALLPLGGFGVENGGHKGFGLGLLAELACGVLSGGAFGLDLPSPESGAQPGKISHFFGALDPNGFRDVEAFKRDVDAELRAFKASGTTAGHDRVYVAGEIEHERTIVHRREGIPIHRKVWTDLERLASELGLPFTMER